jgi:thiopeptide-type bacteriocin biosynthesis protein
MQQSGTTGASWGCVHLYFHESVDRLICDWLFCEWRKAYLVNQDCGWFFVRSCLGGPHLRLRVLEQSSQKGVLVDDLASSARAYMSVAPSLVHVPPSTIEEVNRTIIAHDPGESDSSIYPDNYVRVCDYVPEMARYGGEPSFTFSQAFFRISSLIALAHLRIRAKISRSARLTSAARILLSMARAFARSEAELGVILRYASDSWGGVHSSSITAARSVLRDKARLLRAELFCQEGSSGVHRVDDDFEKTLRACIGINATNLESSLRDLDGGARGVVLTSNVHMMANRLGLSNAEEVFLGTILSNLVEPGDISNPWRTWVDEERRCGWSFEEIQGRSARRLGEAVFGREW